MTKKSNGYFPRGSQITPHFWYRIVLIILILAGIGWYGAFQARNFIQGPTITLNSPTENVQTTRMVTLEGTAENIISLSLNGRNIFTNETGAFKERLVLENGYTIMTLTATDRYGRKTSVSRPFIYTPSDK